ncbi:hypothetical protein [Actinomadura roseirufa]|uniref:hypothetical protein n=1 Tax=Actinomadura roseirufa TaxID=2094049 RepID=UPI001040F247|nr:hypothetical protein [Actinomadura roseirufa]
MNGSAERQRAARNLADQFPGVHDWYGEHTHQRWAMVPGQNGLRLLSAVDIRHLRDQITNSQTWRRR